MGLSNIFNQESCNLLLSLFNPALTGFEDRLSKKSDVKNNAYHQTLAIRKYLIPFFGNTAIYKLNSDDFENYVAYVAKELKRNPSLTTIRKHNVGLSKAYKMPTT